MVYHTWGCAKIFIALFLPHVWYLKIGGNFGGSSFGLGYTTCNGELYTIR